MTACSYSDGHWGQSPPVRLVYQRNIEAVYRIDLDSAACRVSMVLKNIRMTTAFVKGTITGSLYETMMAMGEKPELIADYTDIFGGEPLDLWRRVLRRQQSALALFSTWVEDPDLN